MRLHLIRDILDNQLRDVTGQNAGKVDGLILELRDGEPPRVAYVEVGPVTLLRRVNRRLGDWYARLDARLGDGRGAGYRIPLSRVRIADVDLLLDFRAEPTPIFALEQWLRVHVLEHLPWS